MSLDYSSNSKCSRSYLTCANNVILKELKSLVKQEKFILENENDHLKKNNEELLNRIQELYNEFDISTITYKLEDSVDAVGRLKHLEKKSQKAHKKQINLLKVQSEQLNNLNDLRNQLVSSQDSLSIIKIQSKESDAESIIKDKEIEILEAHNTALKKKMKEIENYNKDLQKECKNMAKSLKNKLKIYEKLATPQQYKDIGLTVTIENNIDTQSTHLHQDMTTVENFPASSSPLYIDIFDNKSKADTLLAKKLSLVDGSLVKEFFQNNKVPENVSPKGSDKKERFLSPIYADISVFKKHKCTLTDPVTENLLKLDNKRERKLEMHESKFSDRFEDKFGKLSHDYEKLNNKLDSFNFNLKNSSTSSTDETLLKKASEDIIRISVEQEQIMNILQKNSKTLEHLGELKKEDLYNANEDLIDKCANKRNLSCQTDLILREDENIKNYELIKLLNDQNNKIQDLCNTVSGIQAHNTCLNNVAPSSLQHLLNFPVMDDHKINRVENFPEQYETSLENISNLSDIIDSFSDKAFANVLNKGDESKSLSSILLSTSESQDTLNKRNDNIFNEDKDVSPYQTMIKNKKIEVSPCQTMTPNKGKDVSPCQTMIPIKTIEVSSLEMMILNKSVKEDNQTNMVNINKFTSKIPKLLKSKSLDLIDNKGLEKEKKTHSNELESSYETLYDPVLSARYENDNATPV